MTWRHDVKIGGLKMNPGSDEKGFTLLEIIATIVILSILAALAIPRYISLDESARQRAIDAGIAELNGRETLTWSNLKISTSGYKDDSKLFDIIDYTLGDKYSWEEGERPDIDGGNLKFKDGSPVMLTRKQSTEINPGSWTR